jgi:hypothetical protein
MIRDGAGMMMQMANRVFAKKPEKRPLLMLTDDKEGADENSSKSAEALGPSASSHVQLLLTSLSCFLFFFCSPAIRSDAEW